MNYTEILNVTKLWLILKQTINEKNSNSNNQKQTAYVNVLDRLTKEKSRSNYNFCSKDLP